MHELAICQALVAQVEGIAAARQAQARQVRIGVGPFSGVEPELLGSAYPLACSGTRAEGSQLVIDRIEPRVRCRTCGAESTAAPNRLLCGSCGDWRTDLLCGDELLLLTVELETQDSEAEIAHV